MGKLFNADEVFQIAVQMEDNAAAFYRRAAGNFADNAATALLERLARMEDDHKKTFEEMRKAMAGPGAGAEQFDLYQEGGQYLAAVASGYRVEGSPAIAESLSGEETLKDIVKIGLNLEKESVLFYLGMKDVVPDELGKDRLDKIIAEEKSHIVTLSKELQGVQE